MPMIIKAFKGKKSFLWLLFMLGFGIIWRGFFLNAPLQSDDTTYFSQASDLSVELFKNASDQRPFRLGILVPLAGLQKVFGYSLTSYYLYSLGSSLFLLLMIYVTGFVTGGFQTALFSSLLFACSFFGLYQATNVLSDVPNLALLLATFLVFMYACGVKGRKRILMLFLSTLLAFCSYLVRAPNLVFLLAIPVYELLTRKSLKSTCLLSIFFLILWLGECCFYQFITGDFFLRIKMIPKGPSVWIKFMPEISWQTYLQKPFTRLTYTHSGSIILWGGLTGTIIAIRKKNYGMIALLTGALLLFVIYSYSVTGVLPLRRALPLKTRYIVAFTAVLTIATGYVLSCLKPMLEKVFSATLAIFVPVFIILVIMTLQIIELPKKLSNTILFKDSSYFVADQLLKEKNNMQELKGKVYAYPAKDFKMYSNFSKLNLYGFVPSDIIGGKYYLYSRKKVRRNLYYGWYGDDEKAVRRQKILLLHSIPKWKYLINTKEIVLAYVPFSEQKLTEAISLAGSYFVGRWGKHKSNKIIEQKVGNSTLFHFDYLEKPFSLFTFPGRFSQPPQENFDIFDKLKPGEIYELKMEYRIQKKIQNLGISFSQYDNTKRIDTVYVNAPSTPGTHVLTELLATSSSYKKFRLFFRIENKEQENQLEIEKISFNLISN